MKIKFKRIIAFSLIAVLLAAMVKAEDYSSQISDAFKSGNSNALSKYFYDHIELSLENSNSIYSKNQAIQVLADFFSKNPPNNFIENNSGEKLNAKFILGSLYTNSGIFNISILLRGESNNMKIYQLSIEKDFF